MGLKGHSGAPGIGLPGAKGDRGIKNAKYSSWRNEAQK